MPLNYGSGNPPPFSPPPPQQYNTPMFPPQSPSSPYGYGGQTPSQGSSGGYNSPYTPGMASQSPYTNTAEGYQSPDSKAAAGKQSGKPTPDWMVSHHSTTKVQ